MCKQQQQRSTRMVNFCTRLRLNTSVDHVERRRMSHSFCWMCFCTLINQCIKLEQRKNHYENSKQQTIDKIYLPNISGDYHGDLVLPPPWMKTWRLLSSRIFFQRTPSSLLWPIRTLFNIMFILNGIFFRVKVPFKFILSAVGHMHRTTVTDLVCSHLVCGKAFGGFAGASR